LCVFVSGAAKSILAFGIYQLSMGVGLLTFPNVLLSLFRIQETDEIWIRVLGLVALGIGLYFLNAARFEDLSFYRASVYVRLSGVIGFVVLAFAIGPPQLLILGGLDLLGLTWTGTALRRRARTKKGQGIP